MPIAIFIIALVVSFWFAVWYGVALDSTGLEWYRVYFLMNIRCEEADICVRNIEKLRERIYKAMGIPSTLLNSSMGWYTVELL